MVKEGDVVEIVGGRKATVLKRKRGGRLVASLGRTRKGESVAGVSGIVLLKPKVVYMVETWL